MTQPYLGQIYLVAFDFAPRNFALCAGQTLPIAQNTALFSLLGTTYGGDGITTFKLPDLRSRVPIHEGQLAGGSNYVLGQVGGQETVTLAIGQIPLHGHQWLASTAGATTNTPGTNELAVGTSPIFVPTANLTPMAAGMISPAGSSQPHPNLMPYQAINYVIALAGIFPSRN